MSRTRNFKPLFPTTGRMTLSVYQDLNNKYESNPQDLKVINNLIDVLQDYIFSVRDLIAFDDDNEIFENNVVPDGYEPFVNDLLLMQELAQIIENRRKENGALDFGNSEIKFILDDDGTILDVTHRHQGPAEKLIENFMVVTNEALAEYMYNLGIEFVYRNHEIPYDDNCLLYTSDAADD